MFKINDLLKASGACAASVATKRAGVCLDAYRLKNDEQQLAAYSIFAASGVTVLHWQDSCLTVS